MAKIVVVDDNLLDNKGVASTAQTLGHEAVRAFTLADGLRAVQAGGVDAVFLDTGLPDGDGVAAVKRFQAGPDEPAVVLMAGPADLERARDAGAAKALPKPVNSRDVAQALEELLAGPGGVQAREQRPQGPPPGQELPAELPQLREFKDAQERRYMERLLQITGGDVGKALDIAGISRASYYNLLKKHGLSAGAKG